MERRTSDKPLEGSDASWERMKQEAGGRLDKAREAGLTRTPSSAKSTDQEQLPLPLEGKGFTDKAEATSKVGEARLPSESLETEKVKLISLEPPVTEQQKILTRVNRWGERDLSKVRPEEWTNREREGLGVESSTYQMEKSGEYTDFVRLGGPNRADVLCLDRQGRLVVVECKGHTAQGAADSGYFGDRGEASGNLASTHQADQLKLFGDQGDKQLFENSSEWLEDNREYMRNALQERIDANSADRASCERVLEAMNRTDFTELNSYQRVVGTAGPEARFGNVGDFVKKVKPNKMIEVNMTLLERDA